MPRSSQHRRAVVGSDATVTGSSWTHLDRGCKTIIKCFDLDQLSGDTDYRYSPTLSTLRDYVAGSIAMEPLLPSIVITASIATTDLSPAELEKTFWDCDFTATYSTITAGETAACSEVYERLKKERFSGSFGDLLVWWRQHKDRELTSRVAPRY